MAPQLILNVFKLSSSRHIQLYQGVYLAKEDFTQLAEIHVSLDRSVFKGLHQEAINNINIIIE